MGPARPPTTQYPTTMLTGFGPPTHVNADLSKNTAAHHTIPDDYANRLRAPNPCQRWPVLEHGPSFIHTYTPLCVYIYIYIYVKISYSTASIYSYIHTVVCIYVYICITNPHGRMVWPVGPVGHSYIYTHPCVYIYICINMYNDSSMDA